VGWSSVGRFGLYKVTLTEEAYRNLWRARELLNARSWEDFSRKILKLVEETKYASKRV